MQNTNILQVQRCPAMQKNQSPGPVLEEVPCDKTLKSQKDHYLNGLKHLRGFSRCTTPEPKNYTRGN